MGRVFGRVVACAALGLTLVSAAEIGALSVSAPVDTAADEIKSLNSVKMNRMQNHMILRLGSQIRDLNAKVKHLEKELAALQLSKSASVEKNRESWLKRKLEIINKDPYVVKTFGANVRTGPSMKYPILRQHRKGDVLFVEGSKNGWFKVANGGWISSRIVKVLESESDLVANME